MYNRSESGWFESTYLAVGEGEVLFSRNVNPAIFGLDITPNEDFLTYSNQFIFLTIRFAPRNGVIVATDMCRKSNTTEEWVYGMK